MQALHNTSISSHKYIVYTIVNCDSDYTSNAHAMLQNTPVWYSEVQYPYMIAGVQYPPFEIIQYGGINISVS